MPVTLDQLAHDTQQLQGLKPILRAHDAKHGDTSTATLEAVISRLCLLEEDVRVIIAYDPTLVSQEQYARLVKAIGNLVRAEGGEGLMRLLPEEDNNE